MTMKGFNYTHLNRVALKMRLYQIGDVTDVYARREGETDRLNNSQIIFEKIGQSIVFGHFSQATDEELDEVAGEVNKVTPSFVFPHDSIIEDDAHIFWQGEEYEITATTNRGNHIISDGKQMEMLSNPDGHNHIEAEDEDGNSLSLPVEQ